MTFDLFSLYVNEMRDAPDQPSKQATRRIWRVAVSETLGERGYYLSGPPVEYNFAVRRYTPFWQRLSDEELHTLCEKMGLRPLPMRNNGYLGPSKERSKEERAKRKASKQENIIALAKEMAAEYDKGLRITDLAEKFELGGGTVRSYLTRIGVALRDDRSARVYGEGHGNQDLAKWRVVRAKLDSGASQSEIAEHLGITRQAVSAMVKRYRDK